MSEQAHEKHSGLVRWALEAVMIGLTIVTLVPTAGASAMAGLALTGLAYDIYASLGEYKDFQLASAATDTDLDKIRSLSDTEPSLTPLLTRIVSASTSQWPPACSSAQSLCAGWHPVARSIRKRWQRSTRPAKRPALILPGRPGNLHDHAWDAADKLVSKMRTEAGHDR
jgi:hypothetical protein